MKIYVGYRYYMYEGCTEPEKIFSTKEKAMEWCKEDCNREFEELELEPVAQREAEPVAWRWKYKEQDDWQHCSANYNPPREAIKDALVVAALSPSSNGGEQK